MFFMQVNSPKPRVSSEQVLSTSPYIFREVHLSGFPQYIPRNLG